MERKLNSLINAFCLDLDQHHLLKTEEILFDTLLRREAFLLNNKGEARVKKFTLLLRKYSGYRKKLFDALCESNFSRELLSQKIFYPQSRLILLLTHACQLRCPYCRVGKFSAVMKVETLLLSIDCLFTSRHHDIQLQFFGGEPLLEFHLIKKGIQYAEKLNKIYKKNISFVITTNGIALSKEKTNFLKNHQVIIECSIDGGIENQLKINRTNSGKVLYDLARKNFEGLFNTDIEHYSISVFTPETVGKVSRNIKKLANMGFKKFQINYCLGVYWNQEAANELFSQTKNVIDWINGKNNLDFINLSKKRREPVVLNAELTVDCDDAVYLETGICLEEDFSAMKKKFHISELKDIKNIDFYKTTVFENFYRLTNAYCNSNKHFRKIILNNIVLGKLYEQFLKDFSADTVNQHIKE
ncbi:MAG: radical SAM protein [Candidatus Omnitrophota bacterium]